MMMMKKSKKERRRRRRRENKTEQVELCELVMYRNEYLCLKVTQKNHAVYFDFHNKQAHTEK